MELSKPVGRPPAIEKGRATVTIVDNDHFQPGVQYLSAVTDSTGTDATDGRNRLQWRVPAAPRRRPRSRSAGNPAPRSCTSPSATPSTAGGGRSWSRRFTAGDKQLFTHDNTNAIKVQVPAAYCYSVFTLYPGFSAERAEVAVKTFDSTPGPVKWTFTPGHYAAAAAAEPRAAHGRPRRHLLGRHRRVVYAMQRGVGATSGLWPPTWNPVALGKPAHNRSPVVTFSAGARLFVGTENGEVHAVDARTGSIVWSRAAGFPPAASSSCRVHGNPGDTRRPVQDLRRPERPAAGRNGHRRSATRSSSRSIPRPGPRSTSTRPAGTRPRPDRQRLRHGGRRLREQQASTSARPEARFTLWGLDLGPSGAPDLKL